MTAPRFDRNWLSGLDASSRRELESLSQEQDSALFREDLLGLGRRLEQAGRPDLAVSIYSELASSTGDSNSTAGISGRARTRLDAILGRGAILPRAEFLVRGLAQQAADPAALAAMGLAGAAFRLTRLAVLSRLALSPTAGFLTRGLGARWVASGAGFLLEAPAFTVGSRGANALLGRDQDWSQAALGREFAGGALTLLGLRCFGGLSAFGVQRWGQGAGMSSALLRGLLPQAGLFTGIVASHRLEESLGLRASHDGATRFTDAFATLLQFHAGGRLAEEGLGEAWNARTRELEMQTQGLALLTAPAELPDTETAPTLAMAGIRPRLLPPTVLAMMGRGTGGRSRRAPAPGQLGFPFASKVRTVPPRPQLPEELPLDLQLAREAARSDTEGLRQTLERLSAPPLQLTARQRLSWLRELGVAAGIPILGEISRDGSPESTTALEALQAMAAPHRAAVLAELRQNLHQAQILTLAPALDAVVALEGVELLEEIRGLSVRGGPFAALAERARVALGDQEMLGLLRDRGATWQATATDRIVALEALGRLGYLDEAVQGLSEFFRYNSRQAYVRAGLALTRLRRDVAIINPAQMIATATSQERAELALAFWETLRPQQAIELWRMVLASGEPRVRQETLRTLGQRDVADLLPELVQQSEDLYPETRMEALRARIAIAQSRRNITALEELLGYTDPSSIERTEAIQIAAARALLRLGNHASATERLEAYLASSFGAHRLQATEALLHSGNSLRAVTALTLLLREPQPELRHQALRIWSQHFESDSPAGNTPPSLANAGLGLLLAAGTAAGLFLDPSQAHAAVGALPEAGHEGLWPILGILGLGALAAVVSRGGGERGSGANPGSNPPDPTLLGWFENPADSEESYFVPRPPDEATMLVGRSTATLRNVFSGDLRNISRSHMDLRVREGRVEVRLHDGARGLRINGYNLAPLNWYLLRDRDVVEFVAEGGQDMLALRPSDEAGEFETYLHRLGRKPLQSSDQPSIFVFRLPRPPRTPVPPRPRRNLGLIEQLGQLAKLFRTDEEETPATASTTTPETDPAREPARDSKPVLAFHDGDEVLKDLHRFSELLTHPFAMLESYLRQPEWRDPGDRGRAQRRDVLKSLLTIHRHLCGKSEQVLALTNPGTGSARPSVRAARLPQWDGVLRLRLDSYRRTLEQLQQRTGPSLLIDAANRELNGIVDRLNRLYELVLLYRRSFQEPEELDQFNAIEAAYRGLRTEVRNEGQRVRSDTRSLDVTVQQQQRSLWAEEFLGSERSSRAVVNMRILMGEIPSVHGLPIAGGLYRTLSGSTIYDGNRSVRVYFDGSSGEILGFEDGSAETQRLMRIHHDQGRRVEEALMSIDAQGTGRIASVTVLGQVRDSIREALVELIGLRVLPPQVIRGATGFQGDPGLQMVQVHLVPDFHAPAEQWFRVAGLARNARPGWSLLTLEANSSESSSPGLQLWLPNLDVLELAVGDPVTAQVESQDISQP